VKNHFNARWYDAATARFISEDPARDGVSWFAYVGSNPLKFVDPTGLRQEVDNTGGELIVEDPTDGDSISRRTSRNEFEKLEYEAQRKLLELRKRLYRMRGLPLAGLSEAEKESLNSGINDVEDNIRQSIMDYVASGFDLRFLHNNSEIHIRRGILGLPQTYPLQIPGMDFEIHVPIEDGVFYDGLLSLNVLGVSISGDIPVQTVTSWSKYFNQSFPTYAPANTGDDPYYTGFLKHDNGDKYGRYIHLVNENLGLPGDSTYVYIHLSRSKYIALSLACMMIFDPTHQSVMDEMNSLGFNFKQRDESVFESIRVIIHGDTPGYEN
jgi:hypothetical protein